MCIYILAVDSVIKDGADPEKVTLHKLPVHKALCFVWLEKERALHKKKLKMSNPILGILGKPSSIHH